MRGKIWQLIVRNWPIKIAAVVLAVMLYIAVQAQQPVTENFEMKLNVDVPPGRSLLQKPPKVYVTISGRGADLIRLRAFPSTITKAVPDTLSTASWQIRLENQDVPLPKGVEVAVLAVTPRDVTVSLDTVTRKEVRVVPLVSVEPESGYVLRGGLSITPSIARLVGPERVLAAIESVTTVPTEITNITGGFQRALAIDTSPLGIIRIAPKQVMLTGEVDALARRTFAGITVESGAGQLVGVTLEPPRVSVSIEGPGQRVDRLTRDSVRVVAVLGGDGVHARLRVLAPPGIDARARPDSVAIKRRTGRPRG
jgi:YbbR domain-containing protein